MKKESTKQRAVKKIRRSASGTCHPVSHDKAELLKVLSGTESSNIPVTESEDGLAMAKKLIDALQEKLELQRETYEAALEEGYEEAYQQILVERAKQQSVPKIRTAEVWVGFDMLEKQMNLPAGAKIVSIHETDTKCHFKVRIASHYEFAELRYDDLSNVGSCFKVNES